MTTRVDLPSGATADLREPSEITEAGRRVYRVWAARCRDAMATAEERGHAMAMTDDAMIAMFVAAWSFDRVIPQADLTGVMSLSTHDYDTLQYEALKRMSDVWVDFSAKKEDLADDAPMDSPFLAAGAPEVAVGGDAGAGAGRPAATGGTEPTDPTVEAREADAVVEG